MRVRLGLSALSLLTLSACYGSSFNATGAAPAWFQPEHRDVSTVKLLTSRPDPSEYVDLGLITASGAGFDGALTRAKEEAAYQGCDAVLLLGEAVESGSGTPGAAYGMTRNHLRASCLVAVPEAKRAPKPAGSSAAAAPSAAAATDACVPACRQTFVCVKGACVSACNPPCGDGQRCIVEPAGPTCAPAPAAP